MNATEQSYEAWYVDVHPRLVASLATAFGDIDLALEAADEACARAFAAWRRVSSMAAPTAWLYRVGLNSAKRRLRRRAIENRLAPPVSVGQIEGPAGEVWLLVAGLPSRQRRAVVLRHVGQLKESEIATAMGISRGGVSSTLRAAYRSLRTQLADEPDRTLAEEAL